MGEGPEDNQINVPDAHDRVSQYTVTDSRIVVVLTGCVRRIESRTVGNRQKVEELKRLLDGA